MLSRCLLLDLQVRVLFFPMLFYHIFEFRFRFLFTLLSLLLSLLIIWEYKYIILFKLSPIGLVYTSLYEAFSSFVVLSFFFCVILNIPYILYQCFSFFSWGLFDYEFKYFFRSILLFLGSLFATFNLYLFILKDFIVSFFIDFEMSLLIHTIRIEDFVSFLLFLFTLTIITLVTPLISIYFVGFRKYFYFLTFFFSALLTPPDIFSLLFMSIPIIILFELRLLYSYLF